MANKYERIAIKAFICASIRETVANKPQTANKIRKSQLKIAKQQLKSVNRK
ncbi:hypothetical protein [Bacillus sp. AFS041924]|uniref:hypothetical protein n=1 Tax=Bacillus sp. AFS041924 TaxID=2033503 RepID=UPI00159BE553|nr:hypothetical protein [Bacillus sp. AFS041924]